MLPNDNVSYLVIWLPSSSKFAVAYQI